MRSTAIFTCYYCCFVTSTCQAEACRLGILCALEVPAVQGKQSAHLKLTYLVRLDPGGEN